MMGLLATIEETRNPGHPWRVELRRAVEKLLKDLATDPEMKARGEVLKAELLENPTFIAQMEFLWIRIEDGLYSDLPGQTETIATAIEAASLGMAKWLDEEPDILARANRYVRLMVLRTLLPRRVEIGAYISRTVESWESFSDLGQQTGTAGRKRSSIYPHQRNPGWRIRRALHFRRDEVV